MRRDITAEEEIPSFSASSASSPADTLPVKAARLSHLNLSTTFLCQDFYTDSSKMNAPDRYESLEIEDVGHTLCLYILCDTVPCACTASHAL